MTSTLFFLSTLNYDARSATHRQLLMMGTWLHETCWAAIRREIKNTKSDIQLVFLIHTEVHNVNLGYRHLINDCCLKASLRHVCLRTGSQLKSGALQKLPPRHTYSLSVGFYQGKYSNLLRGLIAWENLHLQAKLTLFISKYVYTQGPTVHNFTR